MNNFPLGPIILPMITASKPDWLPKFIVESPAFTKCPIRFIL
jgi:hypothetical protein